MIFWGYLVANLKVSWCIMGRDASAKNVGYALHHGTIFVSLNLLIWSIFFLPLQVDNLKCTRDETPAVHIALASVFLSRLGHIPILPGDKIPLGSKESYSKSIYEVIFQESLTCTSHLYSLDKAPISMVVEIKEFGILICRPYQLALRYSESEFR